MLALHKEMVISPLRHTYQGVRYILSHQGACREGDATWIVAATYHSRKDIHQRSLIDDLFCMTIDAVVSFIFILAVPEKYLNRSKRSTAAVADTINVSADTYPHDIMTRL
jgi:hypothetical protein